MNIVISLNRKYIRYTTVLLTSLGMTQQEHMDIYMFHCELTEGDEKKIKDDVSRFDITVHPIRIDTHRFSDKLPKTEDWTIETYFRLLMIEVLPDDIDRAFYIDIDVIVDKDISQLYHSDFENHDVIAFENNNGNYSLEDFGPKGREMFKSIFEKGYKYFNAGVMLYNISQMRTRYSFDTYLKAFSEWDYQMEVLDQDILNYVHYDKVKYEDHIKYDLFARLAHQNGITYEDVKKHVAIIHFAGHKPWNNEMFHFDIEKIWWDYAKETPYYEELRQEFFEDAFSNNYLENFIHNLAIKNEQLSVHVSELSSALSKMKELIKKLSETP